MKKKNGVLTKVNNTDMELLSKNPEKFWKNVREIGQYAFASVNLSSIVIPSTVERIHSYAFYNGHTEEVCIEGEPTIDNFAFQRLDCLIFTSALDGSSKISKNAFGDSLEINQTLFLLPSVEESLRKMLSRRFAENVSLTNTNRVLAHAKDYSNEIFTKLMLNQLDRLRVNKNNSAAVEALCDEIEEEMKKRDENFNPKFVRRAYKLARKRERDELAKRLQSTRSIVEKENIERN